MFEKHVFVKIFLKLIKRERESKEDTENEKRKK